MPQVADQKKKEDIVKQVATDNSVETGGKTTAPTGGYDEQTKALSPVTGDNQYKMTPADDKAWDGKEMSRTRGVGIGRGTGEGDNVQQKKDEKGNPVVDDKGNPVMEDAPANAEIAFDNNVKTWDSKDIEKNNSLGDKKTGAYTETFAGKAGSTSVDPTGGAKLKDGALDTTFAEAKGAMGAGAKVGYKAGVGSETGNNANFDIHTGVNAGMSGSAKIDHNGATAEGAMSATADLVNVSGNADLQKQWKVKGVSDPVKANVGVSGSARVFAEAGIGGKAGISKDFIGVQGEAGAFAGAEAKADVHGTLGPASGKVEASALAGAGIGAKGGIYYKDGKVHISGQLWACYGYGAKIGGEVEIDLKQAVELGIVAAKKAYQWMDEDGDGKITLNDGATKVSKGAQNAANKVDKGVDSFIAATDTDGDGKFTMTDAKALGNQALDYGKKKVDDGIEGAKQLGKDAIAKGKELGKDALKKGEELYEGAKDTGKAALEKGKELYEAIDTPEERAALIEKGKEKAYTMGKNAVDTVVTKGTEAFEYGKDTVKAASKKMGQLKDAAVDKAVDTYEAVRDFDYKGAAVDAKDAIVETGEAAIQKGEELIDSGLKAAQEGAEQVQKAAEKVEEGVKTAYDTLTDEAKRKEALAKAEKYAKWKAHQAYVAAQKAKAEALAKAKAAKEWAAKKAAEAKAEAERLAAEAKKAIVNAPANIKKAASETYSAAKKEVTKAYDTAKEGLSKAGSTLSSAGSKLYNYLF